jgi:hypothetical protein
MRSPQGTVRVVHRWAFSRVLDVDARTIQPRIWYNILEPDDSEGEEEHEDCEVFLPGVYCTETKDALNDGKQPRLRQQRGLRLLRQKKRRCRR